MTIATLTSGFRLKAIAGVTIAVAQETAKEIEATALTKGTSSLRTPNPYGAKTTDLFWFPNTSEELPDSPIREIDPDTNLIMGEQTEEYGDIMARCRVAGNIPHFEGPVAAPSEHLLGPKHDERPDAARVAVVEVEVGMPLVGHRGHLAVHNLPHAHHAVRAPAHQPAVREGRKGCHR